MPGENIAFAKYREGHSKLGAVTVRARLIAHPTYLNVVDAGGGDLFSILWGNFGNVSSSILYKTGFANFGALVMKSIPGLDLTNGSDSFYTGFRIRFYDDEIKRNQDVFFECGTDRKTDQIVRQIMAHRDNFHRNLGDQGRPETR